ncbi:MAG: TetR/AcrR family transcriptional regulator, partial [Coriobacteriales bacterium]|nr:TetR/AcrR family transcriptional regulator [Coriobacteriales bacterium]
MTERSNEPQQKNSTQASRSSLFGDNNHQLPTGLKREQRFESLSKTAQNILLAAWEIVVEEGFAALSFARIAELSGESRGSITYHFGNKEGLILALLDAYTHDTTIGIVEATMRLPLGRDRVEILFTHLSNIAVDRRYVLGFYELFPMTLRNPEMLKSMSDLYDWYRRANLFALYDKEDAF